MLWSQNWVNGISIGIVGASLARAWWAARPRRAAAAKHEPETPAESPRHRRGIVKAWPTATSRSQRAS